MPIHIELFAARTLLKAAQWYKKAAAQGYAQAQGQLGIMYHTGRGGAHSDVEAARWYKKAAEQGHAQCNLGFLFDCGLGVAKNNAEAARW